MSRSLSTVQAMLLGSVVLVGLGLAVGGLFLVGSNYWPWRDTFDLRVPFPQARGIEKGTPVRVQGIDAGEVHEVEPPRKPGEPVLPEFHRRFSAALDDIVKVEALEMRERRNRAIDEAAQKVFAQYRAKAPEVVRYFEDMLRTQGYAPPEPARGAAGASGSAPSG